jgi:hypothetical protein
MLSPVSMLVFSYLITSFPLIKQTSENLHGSGYSKPNKERLRVMAQQGKIIKTVLEKIQTTLDEEFYYPCDIINALQQNKDTWRNFNFTEPYKRIRVAYVDNARKRPIDFQKRLKNLVNKTKNNKKFGYGINQFY